MSNSKLSYLACDHYTGRTDTAPCLNEGLYFCNICRVRLCDSHLCLHLAAQFEHDNDGVCYESTESTRAESIELQYEYAVESEVSQDNSHIEAIHLFRETTESVLREVAEMELRSYMARMMSELKRCQRELERRMIFNCEMQGIKRRSPVLTYEQRELLQGRANTNMEKLAKQRERDEKKKAKVQAALEVLAAAMNKGKMTQEQILNLTKKGA